MVTSINASVVLGIGRSCCISTLRVTVGASALKAGRVQAAKPSATALITNLRIYSSQTGSDPGPPGIHVAADHSKVRPEMGTAQTPPPSRATHRPLSQQYARGCGRCVG